MLAHGGKRLCGTAFLSCHPGLRAGISRTAQHQTGRSRIKSGMTSMKKLLPENARSKVERSQHGFTREAWMGLHDLLNGFARRELFEKEFDRDARAGDDRLSHHDAGIGLNEGRCHPFTYCAM